MAANTITEGAELMRIIIDCTETQAARLMAALTSGLVLAERVELVREEAQAFTPDPQYWSPCPEGYDTVLGYMSKVRPDMCARIDQDAETTQRDGFWLMHRCRERGVRPVKVPACLMLREQGIDEVNSYPIDLLSERFGE